VGVSPFFHDTVVSGNGVDTVLSDADDSILEPSSSLLAMAQQAAMKGR